MSVGGSIAQAAISAWNTYQLGQIAAKHTEDMSNLTNKRMAVKFGLEMYALNEQAATARKKAVSQKLDASALALQQRGSLLVQQAMMGQRGGTAERMQLAQENQAQTMQDEIDEVGYTVQRDAAINEARLRISATQAMQTGVVDKPSSGMALTSFASDVLRIGSTQDGIKGG
jgi:hypothetical protein